MLLPNFSENYFSPDMLRLAWNRLERSNVKNEKEFFGFEICFSNLDIIQERLSLTNLDRHFSHQSSFKYNESVACLKKEVLSPKICFVIGCILHMEDEKGVDCAISKRVSMCNFMVWEFLELMWLMLICIKSLG